MTAKQLKNSILKEAFEGKLTIPSLKNSVKAKNKIDFHSTHDNDNLPKGWEMKTLGEVCDITMGQSPNGKSLININENTNPKAMEFHQGKIYFSNKYILQSNIVTTDIKKIAKKNSVLLCVRAPVGIINITQREIAIGRGLCSLNFKYSNNDFLYFYLLTKINYFNEKSMGSTFKAITLDIIKNTKIPIPPIEEQKRIVNKLNELMPLIEEYEKLENRLNELDKKFPERLKKSILKEAVCGRLVSQNKEDEPASELLKRIKAEREKLIKEKKIKADKKTSIIYRKGNSYCEIRDGREICIDDEIPFKIPNSWEWSKLLFVSDMFTGNSINENEKNLKYKGLSEGYFYIATKDVSFNNEIYYDNGIRIPKNTENFRIAPKNSILFCIEGGSAGKKIAITDKDICFGNKLCCFISYGIDIKYLYYYLQNPIFTYNFKRNTTGIIGGVSINNLKQMILPIPPIEEQKRIVKKLKKLMDLCEKMTKATICN